MHGMIKTRRQLVQGGLAVAMAGCASRPGLRVGGNGLAPEFAGLKPLNLSPGRLMKITVCIRPFRAAGPRLEVEKLGDKLVVHNYGHGGSGWSLSWGYADAARALAMEAAFKSAGPQSARPQSVAVIGAGAMGLTTAIALQQTGTPTTIYAREFPAETRSARATGVWSPSSRIGLADSVVPSFPDFWEKMSRRSYARHLHYIGITGTPVAFTPRFHIPGDPDNPPPQTPETEGRNGGDFLHLHRRLQDLIPSWRSFEAEEHPFRAPENAERSVRGGIDMVFNVAEYSHRLLTDFLNLGGKIQRADFKNPADVLALPQPVIANCSGYGARTLWSDDSLIPVRGQIAWLAPQTDRLFGIHHNSVTALSRTDGTLIQYSGPNDYFGYGIENEEPDRAEFDMALARVSPAFSQWTT
ncbi:MAG: FAD-dependent oxidoreductase [Pseudomonadota bacterium]